MTLSHTAFFFCVCVCGLKYTEDQEKQEQVLQGICILKNKKRCKQILMKDSSAQNGQETYMDPKS